LLSNAELLTAATQLVMAALGALARILNKHETLQLSHTLREIFLAMFTALMLFWLASALELSGGWLFAVSGVMGLMGSSALDWISALVADKMGIKPGKPTAAEPTRTGQEGE
jgi:hypothetical protein